MAVQDRIQRYRAKGAGAGLIRVEVLVPPDGRNAILSEASRLRDEHREGLSENLARLYNEALTRFGARCLWSASPSKSVEGLKVVADHLQRYGGMDAWEMATDIQEELNIAPR